MAPFTRKPGPRKGKPGPRKGFSVQRKVQCVLWFAKLERMISVQREYQRMFGEKPPHHSMIHRWDRQFKVTGSLLKKIHCGPSVSDTSVDDIREQYTRSPTTSVRSCARRLGVRKSTVHRVLRYRLKFRGNKPQLLHEILPTDYSKRFNFGVEMLHQIDTDPLFLNKIVLSDEATFHVSGRVHKHNVRTWAKENPHVYVEHQRNSPKVNVWCALAHDRVIGPYFITEKTIKSEPYLDMLENYAMPQIKEVSNVIFQEDGAPPHWAHIVRERLAGMATQVT